MLGTFVNLIKAPRALWGINISYLLEGLAYFGVLTILGKYLSEDVGMSDIHAGWVYSIFTGGITFSMLVLGGVSDKIGVRKALLLALTMMIIGRSLLGASGSFFEHGGGAGSPMFFTVLGGLFFIVIGYGMYQPAAYAGVKVFTNKKTAAIGFAMLYALMNLGAFFSGIISPPVRQATSMTGVYWVYVVITVLAFLSVLGILTAAVVRRAKEKVKEDDARIDAEEAAKKGPGDATEKAAAEEEEKTTEEKKPAPQKKPLLEPVTIVLFLLVAAGVGGFLYNMINAPEDELTAAMKRRAGSMGALWGAVSSPNADNAAATDALVKEAGPIITTLSPSRDTLAEDPDVDAARIDLSAFALAKIKIQADTKLADALAKIEDPAAIPELSKKDTLALRDILRTHSIAVMAAAYGLTLEGQTDRSVVGSLRLKMKEVDEEVIPMDDETEAAVAEMASSEPAQMLATLHRGTSMRAKEIEELLGRDKVPALLAGLEAEASFAQEAVKVCDHEFGPVGKRVLTEKLIGDSLTALTQARLLVRAVKETGFIEEMTESLTAFLMDLTGTEQADAGAASSFASVKIDGNVGIDTEIGSLLPEARPKKTGAAVKSFFLSYGVFIIPAFILLVVLVRRLLMLRPEHPFHDKRFTFFIFVLIPVQTLFAHNWLTLPYYIDRAFSGTAVGDNFEFFSNLNPILIFVLAPVIAALTTRTKPYRMMIAGTLVMALPTFLLALPASPTMLLTYIVLMTVGEAMWQPRFLQLVAEIAPEGKTGAYMGIGQLPWFLTKLITGMYSGYFVATYVPKVGPQNPELMWLIYGFIAMISPIALFLAKGWMGSHLEKRHT